MILTNIRVVQHHLIIILGLLGGDIDAEHLGYQVCSRVHGDDDDDSDADDDHLEYQVWYHSDDDDNEADDDEVYDDADDDDVDDDHLVYQGWSRVHGWAPWPGLPLAAKLVHMLQYKFGPGKCFWVYDLGPRSICAFPYIPFLCEHVLKDNRLSIWASWSTCVFF